MQDTTIIAWGSIGEGFGFAGPFADGVEAAEWARANLDDEVWWIQLMRSPDDGDWKIPLRDLP